ncbi:hypothetical protein SOASR014_11900 [Pectobacterium carotovorum subsp. carotovorum]|nr:hypothetical protein SOASR014_11900 [Pectobacterium carotovorum subsp. carotovorum]GLX44350.1 hypothetical protein Pcaca01_20180 [Pectobacterium carotovorum subsp. carotovorum]
MRKLRNQMILKDKNKTIRFVLILNSYTRLFRGSSRKATGNCAQKRDYLLVLCPYFSGVKIMLRRDRT